MKDEGAGIAESESPAESPAGKKVDPEWPGFPNPRKSGRHLSGNVSALTAPDPTL